MTKKEIVEEFERWVNLSKPAVWTKSIDTHSSWTKKEYVCWDSIDILHYIIDDKNSEFRKLQIDDPETKFQILQYQETGLDEDRNTKVNEVWTDCVPDWGNMLNKYRIKPKEWYEDQNMIEKPVWCRDNSCDDFCIEIFKGYVKGDKEPFKCDINNWEYAKPIKPEDCYQGYTK